ncbi:hypothetical protein [Nitratifractor salsuginis]|uniref:Lipoprotein n=1 Tax=Nitratifractor salsuginis (strain DSM 16511 / JCM 12458 / E9I37-1) TaxID=749222 RepID=E6X0U1_NITSE|nr:hypothetical protein [Nitratifractor salsuginis]ADV46873.1 hypothetical protein Nitsa_1625 [Nitratifractor salsuginis DSM 16511]
MRKKVKIAILGIGGILLFSGCAPRLPAPPALTDQNRSVHRVMWEDTSGVEKNYSLKPEPYSIDSGQKDPELLGPQSTLKKRLPGDEESLAGSEMVETTQATTPQSASAEEETFLARDEQKTPATSRPAMTRSRCIELIGQSDFDKYTRQFGSEEAALRKCIILERVQKR